MSPILTRPIREQLEHDRIIRQLQARYKRKHEVTINPGLEQNQAVTVGDLAVYPDLLLYSQKGRRLEGTVEVETGESVNQLEALAEWGVFSKLKAPFYLYVPPQSLDSARRICDEHQFPVAEIWTYHLSLDQVRFTQVYRSPHAPKPSATPTGAAQKGPAAKAVPARKAAKAAPAKKSGDGVKTRKAVAVQASKPARNAARPAKTRKHTAARRAARPVRPVKAGASRAAARKRR